MARPTVMVSGRGQEDMSSSFTVTEHTFTLLIAPVNADACYKNVMHHGKAALAADPAAISGPNTSIVEDGSFVQEHAPVVDVTCKRDLVGVKVVEAGLILDVSRVVAENVSDGV